MIVSPHEALVALLRKSGIPKLDWANGPAYMQLPEPAGEDKPSPFPYLTYLLEGKTFEPTFEPPYLQSYTVSFFLYALQPDIFAMASEFGSTVQSVFAYLDQFVSNPGQLSGDQFTAVRWLRDGPVDYALTTYRAPDTSWVWMATAKYELTVSGNLG